MRTVGSTLAAHLATGATTLCAMVRLDLVDGSVLAFTDHDRALSFDLGDGAVEYLPDSGVRISDIALSSGFDADDVELVGPIGETVTRVAVRGGRFDDATVRIFLVNWADLTQGAIRLLSGTVVQAAEEGPRFKLTAHSQASKFAQEVGTTISAYCRADFGDARCGYTVTPLSATVTAVTDARQFTVSFSGSYANDYFNRGTVTFTGGALNGCRPVEVFDWTSLGAVTLWTALPEAPEIGDTLELRQGCGKTRPDCLAYDNVINFRGFPDVPGSDQVLKYPSGGGA